MARTAMILCAALCLSGPDDQHARHMDEKQQVWRAVRAWNTAFERNDADGFFHYMHDDVSLFVPSCPYRIEGREPDRKGYDNGLATGRSRVVFFQEMQPLITVIGNVALVTYHTRGCYGPPGAERTVDMKETNVLVKENDAWKVLHVHLSE